MNKETKREANHLVISGLYYNRLTIVATIVTQISWIILIIFKLLNVITNNLAYLGYNRSYELLRSYVAIVQATDGGHMSFRQSSTGGEHSPPAEPKVVT